MITLNCKKCKKEFKIYQSRIKVGKGKFCSRSCSNSVNGIGNTRAVGNTAWVGRKHKDDSKLKMKLANINKRYSLATEFKKGLTPWNKGLPSPQLVIRNAINNPTKKGSASHLWKGGITPINTAIRSSLGYKLWRKGVFERDNFTCQECKQVGVELNAHHIKRFSDYPKLRLELSNGRTLCVPCHKKTNTYGRVGICRDLIASAQEA